MQIIIYIPDDGPVWPKHAMILHENVDYVAIPPIIHEFALKAVLHIYIERGGGEREGEV
jgi:hypothetical protein